MPTIISDATNQASEADKIDECKSCDLEDCFVKTSKGVSQKCSTMWVGCDLCKEWFHGTCQGLQPAEVSFLDKMDNKGVKWFCNDCIAEIEPAIDGKKANLSSPAENTPANNKLKNIEGTINKIATNLSTSNAALNNRMDMMKASYAEARTSNTEGV